MEKVDLSRVYKNEKKDPLLGIASLLIAIGEKVNEVVEELNKREVAETVNINCLLYKSTNQFRFQRRKQICNYGNGRFGAPVQQKEKSIDVLQQLFFCANDGNQGVWLDVPVTEEPTNFYCKQEEG